MSNFKRAILYCLFLLAVSSIIGWRYLSNESKKNKSMASFTSIYLDEGVPVEVEKVQNGELKLFMKISVVKDGHSFIARVTKQDKLKLKEGLDVYDADLEKKVGKVTFVGNQISYDNGLYKIKMELNHSPSNELIIPLRIHYSSISNCNKVPIKAILAEGEKNYVWSVKDNLPIKKEVEFTKYNQSYVKIDKGLQKEDFIVVNGHRTLAAGQKLMILGSE